MFKQTPSTLQEHPVSVPNSLPRQPSQSQMNPNLRLYKLNQFGTQGYVQRVLQKHEISYETFKGNIFSAPYPDRPLFVAHMDTVGEADVGVKLKVKNGILSRRGSKVLGADDKAGVDILLKNIEDINFCFTVDEEIGCLGATALLSHEPFLDMVERTPCAIEYDRRNNADLIAYCGTDLIQKVESLTHYKKAEGLFTDVTQWEDIIPSVNLSVGYYGAHTGNEFLSIPQWQICAATLPILNELRGTFDLSPVTARYSCPSTASYGYQTYNYSEWEDDDLVPDNIGNSWAEENLKVCEYCGAKEDLDTNFYQASGYDILCESCLSFMYGIRKL